LVEEWESRKMARNAIEGIKMSISYHCGQLGLHTLGHSANSVASHLGMTEMSIDLLAPMDHCLRTALRLLTFQNSKGLSIREGPQAKGTGQGWKTADVHRIVKAAPSK
jgi:hypothetical protein